ncbi:coiled-coil domain-containing protein 158-like isoform X2 [Cololabis saira]|uniref:coiled-coil domain-containing protein 158-like isoform X2 n=1 Tax=Cololabis saira TaxID=129043 RepID=UPI002AD4799A|nr:coiled-coil domain-containing protein 158-like isoform X2 [Cololabis saira]
MIISNTEDFIARLSPDVIGLHSPNDTLPTQTPETPCADRLLRFNSLTLDELSEELERRTKETKRLQEEVECATRVAFQRLRGACSNGSPGESWHNYRFTVRLKDSRKHVDQMEKMLCLLQEVQNIKMSSDQKLQETEDEALDLHGKVETLERTMREVCHALPEKQCGHSSICNKDPNKQTLRSLAYVNEVLRRDTEKLQEKGFSSKRKPRSEEYNGINKQESMEELITSLGQEMALLTNELSSSKDHSIRLCDKLELLKKLAERRASVHRCQISELESTLSSYRDKVCGLEQQLREARLLKVCNTQKERAQSQQHAKELQSQLGQLERCCEQQQFELQGNAEVLRRQLDIVREQLCKAEVEKVCLQARLEHKAREGSKSLELLQEKDEELQISQDQIQKHLTRLEEAHSQCQSLQTERETLRLKLNDREKMIETLRLQMESSVTLDSLQQENSLLIIQLNQNKLEIQQLKADLVQHKSDLAAVEREKGHLQTSGTEQSRQIQEETLKKQKVTRQLELQRMQLLTLTKEHKELQQLHSCRNDEHEGVVLKLQEQLRSAQEELEKIRRATRTLRGVDGHGFQMAVEMQKEITARREQVDSLQSRIKHLEERTEKLQQEKRQQNLETQRQLQEFALIREEKRQLTSELKVLRSKDQQLRERISELEAILHKMSERFAGCQDFIQTREQEYFRLKLQHALDLKELKGQPVCAALPAAPPDVDSWIPSAKDAAPPSSRRGSNTHIKWKKQRERSAGELTSLVAELRGVLSERPHTDQSPPGSRSHRRRSAPERERTTTPAHTDEDVLAASRLRRRTCGSSPRFLKTAEANRKTTGAESLGIWSLATAVQHPYSFLQLPGRKSPVHALLTSDPDS